MSGFDALFDKETDNAFSYKKLFQKAVQRDPNLLRVMVEKGELDLNRVNEEGYSPIHLAALYAPPSVIRDMVELGADIHAVTPEGQTALHCAAWKGNTEAIPVLLELGINAGAKTNAGRTAREYAEQEQHKQAAEMIGDHARSTSHARMVKAARIGARKPKNT